MSDPAVFAAALSVRLRERGVAVGVTAIEDFVRALVAAPPQSRTRLYWMARISLVHRQSELVAFDAVFETAFGSGQDAGPRAGAHVAGAQPRASVDEGDSLLAVRGRSARDEPGIDLPWITAPRPVADADDSDDSDASTVLPLLLPSRLERMSDLPFEELSRSDWESLGRWLDVAARSWPVRRSRRLVVDAHGRRVSVRRTIARSRRTGWDAGELVRVRPVDRPRRVVMLCDVSQSMQAQTAAYLHLGRALALTVDAEVFAFATTLTRLTNVLRHSSAGVTMEEATAKVGDRFGGTRIATNIQALLSSHHGGTLRGAIVVIGSDGWDSDSPDQLAAAMARLRRRAHRVIWMNPRATAPGFEPTVATMAAALPYCDALVPADTFGSLARVVSEIAASPTRVG